MKSKNRVIYNIALVSLFTAIIIMSAQISVPAFAVPFTMQTLGVFTAVAILGFKRGFVATVTYILLGVVGLPVFHGFQGGVGVLMGSTGGFLLGFLPAAVTIGLLYNRKHNSKLRLISAFVLAQLVCYVCGVAWFCWVYTSNKGFLSAVLTTVVPFIFFDMLKIIIATVIVSRVKIKLK